MTKRHTASILLVALCGAMIVLAFDADASEDDLARLVEWMTGSFSSSQQAADDEAYFDIRLEMVRIWPELAEGYWLYVEQAAAETLDRPYRQRIYHVTKLEDGLFKSAVFAIPNQERYVGAWRKDDPLGDISPEDLGLRDGCSVFLRMSDEGEFAGATKGRLCVSTISGASYATSEVVVHRDGITSWDRGFDASGTQVWGAEKGPYVFTRH